MSYEYDAEPYISIAKECVEIIAKHGLTIKEAKGVLANVQVILDMVKVITPELFS
jgi:hypothetical protein